MAVSTVCILQILRRLSRSNAMRQFIEQKNLSGTAF